MIKNIKVLWLVAARSGSKAIPHKNIRLLNGIPLLAHRIISAKKSNYSSDVWISTDAFKYAEIAKDYGAKCNFIRPNELALDTSNSADVVLHAMKYAEEHGHKFDLIGLLEPILLDIFEKVQRKRDIWVSNKNNIHALSTLAQI